GTFHAHVGPALVHRGPGPGRRLEHDAAQRPTERVRKTDVRHDPVAEERADAVARAVVELIGYDQMSRLDGLTQTPDGAGRQDPFDAEHLEAVDVRPVVQLGGLVAVTRAVAREKRDAS